MVVWLNLRLIFELFNVGKVELENGESHLWEEVQGNKNYSLIVSEATTPDDVLAFREFYLETYKSFTIDVNGNWLR